MCQNQDMSQFLYKISLNNCNDVDKYVIKQAINTHIPRTEIISDNENSDLILSGDTSSPCRIGNILDHIEREMFNNQYPDYIEHSHYFLDWKASQLTIQKEVYDLSDREKTLVVELLLSKDKGCTRGYLLEKIWDYRSDLETHALETQIYRLRQKIESEPDNPTRLITIDGGYQLRPSQ